MSQDETRVGDEERERVAARLRTAAGEGRLGVDELEERLERAFAARTRADLAPLTADLPARRTPRDAAPARSRAQRPDLMPYLATMALLVAIWALTGAGYFWPIWPMLGWGLAFLPGGAGACGARHRHRRRRRAHG
jgi:hypothetical protein